MVKIPEESLHISITKSLHVLSIVDNSIIGRMDEKTSSNETTSENDSLSNDIDCNLGISHEIKRNGNTNQRN